MKKNHLSCGCCEGVEQITPLQLYNLPGLSALVYRVGDYSSFLETMLSSISKKHELIKLSTRDQDDPSIALLDAWAMVLDILSFYQERIANECFLKTATERLSVLEMARHINYKLKPGVAAATYLAITVDDDEDLPDEITIQKGLQVQSIPGPDERSQVFETVEEIKAKKEWNAIKPKLTEQLNLNEGLEVIRIKGTSYNLNEGDVLLFQSSNDPIKWELRKINAIETGYSELSNEDEEIGFTKLTIDLQLSNNYQSVYAMRLHAALFGYNAPDWMSMSLTAKAGYLGLDPENDKTEISKFLEWPGFNISSVNGDSGNGLHGSYFKYEYINNCFDVINGWRYDNIDPQINFDWGDKSPNQELLPKKFAIRWQGWLIPKVSGNYTFRVRKKGGVRLTLYEGEVENIIINEWTEEKNESYSRDLIWFTECKEKRIKLEYFGGKDEALIELFWKRDDTNHWEFVPNDQLYTEFPLLQESLHLDAYYSSIRKNSLVVLANSNKKSILTVEAAEPDTRTKFSINSKTTRITFKENIPDTFNEAIRETQVYANSEELVIAESPDIDPIKSNEITLNSVVEGLKKNQKLIITGKREPSTEEDEYISELIEIDSVTPEDVNPTIITLKEDLKNIYNRATVTISANVSLVTHGESTTEVLGSGDATQKFQEFELKQNPLTYITTGDAAGLLSTLEIRVNSIKWNEVPTLFNRLSNEKIFTTRIDNEGIVHVQFGDGETGSRLPAGIDNVTATLRVGTGMEGMLRKEQISLLLSQEMGIKEVINPLAPGDAENPESMDDARKNAPGKVLTMDRIVSMQDFEDFTRAFPGIGKARADMIHIDRNQIVHLTVASAIKNAVSQELLKKLKNSIDTVRHPRQQIEINPYREKYFALDTKIQVNPDYLSDLVAAQVIKKLKETFSFEKREFGQDVTPSEVISVIQEVDGIISVDLNRLGEEIIPTEKKHFRVASNSAYCYKNKGIRVFVAAELLLIDPNGIIIEY